MQCHDQSTQPCRSYHSVSDAVLCYGVFYSILFSFWPIHIFNTDTQIYTLNHYNIIYNIGRAALEQAYRRSCKFGSNYIHIHLCTKCTSIKSRKNNIHNKCFARKCIPNIHSIKRMVKEMVQVLLLMYIIKFYLI